MERKDLFSAAAFIGIMISDTLANRNYNVGTQISRALDFGESMEAEAQARQEKASESDKAAKKSKKKKD